MAVLAGVCVAVLLTLMIGTSVNNSGKYYIKDTHAGLEIWKGQFAPISTEKLAFLKDMDFTGTTKAIYSKEEALPIPFNYYMDKAEALIKSESVPEFEAIIDFVEKASKFAITPEQKETIALYRTKTQEAFADFEETRIILPAQPLEEVTSPAVTEEEAVPAVTEEEAVPAVTEEEAVPAVTEEEVVPAVTEEETVPAATEEHVTKDSESHN
jgi:hypothetical protein